MGNELLTLDSSPHDKIQALFCTYTKFDDKWKIVVTASHSVTHLIYCSVCQAAWELYKFNGKSVRSNSSANILPHKCTKFTAPRIVDVAQCEMTQAVRKKVAQKFTKILGSHPTV